MTEKISPLRAIRNHCRQCSGFVLKEIRFCPASNCSLYPYRFGTNPARKGVGRLTKVEINPNVSEIRGEKPKTEENQPLNEAMREVPLV